MENFSKEEFLSIYYNLVEEGVNFEETPVLFKWNYEDEPYVEFQLLIRETKYPASDGDLQIH